MEIETIKEDAKKALIGLLNRSLQVEYVFIINYPRLIDKLVNYDNIRDEQLTKDIETLGKDSMRHFGDISNLVERLGGKPVWSMDVIARLEDVEELLVKQLKREKAVLSMFEDAKSMVLANKAKVRVREFFGKVIRVRGGLSEDIVTVDDVIGVLDREMWDEKKHIRLVEDSIATFRALIKRRPGDG